MQEANLAVPLLSPDQSSPRSGGPVGRVRRLLNGIVRKHRPDGSIKAEKRGGFPLLSRNVSQVWNGTALGATGVPGTTLMGTLGDELVQIGNSVPHVYAPAGPRYEQFQHLVMTETAFRTIVQAGGKSLSRSDGAVLGQVACYLWTDGTNSYAEFVDLTTRTPIRTPVTLGGATRAKVVSDGVRFWIVTDTGTLTPTVAAFGADGVQQGSATATTFGDVGAIWDITAMPGTGNGAVIAHNIGQAIVNYVRLVFFTFVGGVIAVSAPAINQHLPATFNLGFLRNDFDPTHLYLATAVQFVYTFGADPTRTRGVYVGRMTLAGAHDAIYPIDGSMTQAQAAAIMGLTGYVASASQDVYVSFAQFANAGGSPGRPMNSTTTTWYSPSPGSTALQGVKHSVSLAGRVFKLGSRYVIPTYYGSVSQESASVLDPIPLAQPTYFLVDAPTQDIVGELEFGTASMDWAHTGWDPAQLWGPGFGWLPSPFADATGIVHLPFGFAADEETSQKIISPSVLASNVAVPIAGVLDIQLGGRGVPIEFADALLVPGPRAVAFSRDVFASAGFELGPETPGTGGVNSGSGVMVVGEQHRYAIVYSALDSQGNRIRSIASITTAARIVAPGQNAIQLSIPTLRMTSLPTILIEVYRDVWDTTTSVASPELHKITVDQLVTGDNRTVIYNDPTVDTITFTDTVTNAAAAIGARIYTDDGTLDYEACPPFSCGCVLGDRVFVGGYDNRVYYSFSKVPGQAIAFNTDEFFITLPTRQKVTAIVPLDNRIFIFTLGGRIFYVDGGNFLSADGTSGENPTPIELQFRDGCTGRAVATTAGIIYDSTAGGLWLLTRGLEKIFIGKPVEDETAGLTCLDIAIDADQRMAFLYGGSKIVTFDPVHNVWSPWSLTAAGVAMCAWRGRMAWADNEATQRTYQHDPTVYSDNGAPIQTRVDIDNMSLADINGFQVIWEVSALGEWKGAHTFNVDLNYDGSDSIDETFSETFAALVDPFRFDWQPRTTECSAIGISIYDTFPGNVPSQGFTLESLGLYVGVERGAKYQERRIAPTG